MHVGFVGLGTMGLPMARSLVQAGHDLTVYDIRPEAVDVLVSEGARCAVSAADLAAKVELVLVALVDDAQVEAELLGDDGILANATGCAAVIVHSTVHP